MDFPGSPSLGQDYTLGGRTWRWNGTAWARLMNSGQSAAVWVANSTAWVNEFEGFDPLGPDDWTLLTYI